MIYSLTMNSKCLTFLIVIIAYCNKVFGKIDQINFKNANGDPETSYSTETISSDFESILVVSLRFVQ